MTATIEIESGSIMNLSESARAERFRAIDAEFAECLAEARRLVADGVSLPRRLPRRDEGQSFADYETAIRRLAAEEVPIIRHVKPESFLKRHSGALSGLGLGIIAFAIVLANLLAA